MASASKNIFWLSLSRIIALVLLFVAYTQLFRYLGPYTSGQYQFVLSYVTIFGIIIDFGIQQYIIKKISEQPDQAKKYFHNFLAVEAVLVVVIFSLLYTIAKLNHYEPVVLHTIIVAGLGTALNGLSYPFLSVMSAFYDLKKVAFINFLNSLINTGMIFGVIYFHKHIVLLASNQLVFAVMGLILYYQFIKKYIPKPDLLAALRALDWQLVRQIFIAAFPFALLVGFSTIYNRIDVVLITKFLGYTETGFYTAAYKFFDLMAFFPAVVSHSLYPVFAALMAKRDLITVRLMIEKYLRFLLALALPIGVGGMLLARPIITLLAGPEFADAAPALAILAWAPAVLFVYIIANALVISQLTKFAVAITGANVLTNVLGNILLLPRLGIRAAAIMTVASESLQALFYFYFVRQKITRFSFFAQAWKPALASAVMGVLVWQIRNFTFIKFTVFGQHQTLAIGANLLCLIILGAAIYVSVLAMLNFFHKDDITFLKNFIRPQSAGVPGPM
jgi:O-antigen/teichoic acid export membrane protein